MHLTVLVRPDCPNAPVLKDRLAGVLDGRADVSVSHEVISDEADASSWGMHGSPTLLIDGVDPFAEPGQLPSLSCRLYRADDGQVSGAPSASQLQQVIEHALATAAQTSDPTWLDSAGRGGRGVPVLRAAHASPGTYRRPGNRVRHVRDRCPGHLGYDRPPRSDRISRSVHRRADHRPRPRGQEHLGPGDRRGLRRPHPWRLCRAIGIGLLRIHQLLHHRDSRHSMGSRPPGHHWEHTGPRTRFAARHRHLRPATKLASNGLAGQCRPCIRLHQGC